MTTKDWYQEYLASDYWREMRRRAFERYGRHCQVLDCRKKRLHIHHLSYEFIGGQRELLDIRPLCWWHHFLCHRKLLTWKKIPLNRKHLTKRYMEVKRFTWRYFKPSDWLRL